MQKNNYLITYFLGSGLSPTEACLLSKIQELEKNLGECTLSNLFFSDYLGVSKSTIKRSMDRLEGLGLIRTTIIKGANRKKRKIRTDQSRIKRVLLESEVQNEPHITENEGQNEPHVTESEGQNEPHITESEVQNESKWGSKRIKVGFKMNQSGVQNDPIKINNKINNKLNNKLKAKSPEANSNDLKDSNEEFNENEVFNEFENDEILDLESYEDIEPVTDEANNKKEIT